MSSPRLEHRVARHAPHEGRFIKQWKMMLFFRFDIKHQFMHHVRYADDTQFG